MSVYKVYSDSYLLHDDNLFNYRIYAPRIELELNKTGSFEFVIYNDHPYYSFIYKLKSIITVYQDDFLLFRGRVLNDELGFHEEKHVSCEGELSFFLDSIQRPYEYTGTIANYLSNLITNHNEQVDAAKQFTIGSVTVSGNITKNEIEYINTWDSIQKNLIEAFGGYIMVRRSGSTNYIDYLSGLSTISTQKIEFSKNLIDMKRIRKGEEILTALIPLGAKLTDAEGNETDERLTVKSVNNNLDYIYNQTAVNTYGWIVKSHVWDEIESASDLMAAGQTYLTENINLDESIELDAVDLATVNENIYSFRVGQYVNVVSDPHNIDENMLVSKMSINLLNPAENKLVLGKKTTGLTDNIQFDEESIINNVKGEIKEQIVHETISQASSLIDQSATEIMTQVSEGYYLKTDGQELGRQISGLSTTFTQTTRAFEMQFTQVNGDIETLDEGMIEVHQYIRFEGGNIILGESGNELTLKIENDRITFYDGFHAVAYFTNDRLFVTDGEFTNSLRLGNFAFVPRQNGNLSFMKVV